MARGWWRLAHIVTGLAAGAHTVNYSTVSGYTNPANQSVTISPNQLAAVEGNYQLISGDTSYRPVCTGYDGDKFADPAMYDPSTGTLVMRLSSAGYIIVALPEFLKP